MDVKLDSLIEKIKKEGIEEAQQTSDDLIKDAKSKAASIVDQARKESEKIVGDGNRKADQFRVNAEADIRQAAKNTELLLKEKINNLFDNVFKQEVAKQMKPDFLKELILKIINSWAKDSKVDVVVSDADKGKLQSILFSGLKGKLKDSITLKASKDVSKGFRIGMKDDQVYYDFSDDTIADVLKTLLNPSLKEILDK